MGRALNKLGTVIENRRRLVIIIAAILIAVSFFGASRITMSTGTETFLSTDSKTYKDYERFNEHFGSSSIVVMLTGDDMDQLLQIDNLKAMEFVEDRIGANPGIMSAIGPTFLMKQAVATYTGTTTLPASAEEAISIVIEPQSGQIRSDFSSVLPDSKHALIHVVMGGMYYTGDDVTALIEETESAVNEAGFVDVETALTGPPAFMAQIEDMMTTNMGIMFFVSTLLMLLILALIFGVRGFFAWRWLPLGVVGLGIVYTFGATGLLSIPITMVSMSAFPILVGLGIDYSIQIHNRYDEEVRKGNPPQEAVKLSLIFIGPSIGVAVVAVCLSFVAMLFSPVPMIQDFGLMLLIGVVASYLVAMVVPLSILYWRDRRAELKAIITTKVETVLAEQERFIERGLRHLASWVINYPAVIIPIAIAITVVGLIYDPRIDTETNETNMISQDVPAMKNYQTLKDIMAGEIQLNVFVEGHDVTDPGVVSWMAEYEDQISAELSDDVCSTNSITDIVLRTNGGQIPDNSEKIKHCVAEFPKPIARNLVNDDYTAANIIVGLVKTEQNEVDQLREIREELQDYASSHPDNINVSITGARSLGPDLLDAFTSGRLKITLIGVGLVFLGLLFLFRFNLLKALLATIPIGLIIGWSSGIMYASGTKYSALTACLGALILGIGVEYTILLLRRYYEEREKGQWPKEAMMTAMTRIGRAIMASALTTIAGFAALLAATDFLALRDLGMMTVIDLFLALLSTLILLPALVVWIDSWRERRRLVTVKET